jgi:phospho-N-acetylmuramoyl-pentapeptide-transferase
MTVAIIQALVLAFAFVVILVPTYMRLLRAAGMGKHIRVEDGPGGHEGKEGTPTMGGLLLVIVVLLLATIFGAWEPSTAPTLLALLGVGILGAADDILNARTGVGIRGRHKIIWQVVVAVAAALYLQNHFGFTGFRAPLVGDVFVGPVPWIAIAVVAIVGSSNGVNLTDGLDGLAGGTLVFAFLAFMFIALLNVPTQSNLGLVCALTAGAMIGFLWFNVHPASIFMGDAGSLSFGAALAVTALMTGQVLILPVVGIVFVMEAGSVMLQIPYYKLTHGKRIFLFTPLHHHFEMLGWAETKVTGRFWIVGALGGLLGVTFFLSSIRAIQ